MVSGRRFVFLVLAAALAALSGASADRRHGGGLEWAKWRDLCLNGGNAPEGELTRLVVERFERLRAAKAPEGELEAAVEDLTALLGLKTGEKGDFCWRPAGPSAWRLVDAGGLFGAAIALAPPAAAQRADRALLRLVRAFRRRTRPGGSAELVADPRSRKAARRVAPLVHKILALTSPESTREHLSAALVRDLAAYDENAVRLWAGVYLTRMAVTSHVEERTLGNVRWLLRNFDEVVLPHWRVPGSLAHMVFYLSTYADPAADAGVKRRMNELVRGGQDPAEAALWERRAAGHAPRARLRVAVVSQTWFRRHAVHRTLWRYVAALQREADVDLFVHGRRHDDDDADGFARVVRLADGGTPTDAVAELVRLCRDVPRGSGRFAYDVLYLPDVGMSALSVFAANVRLAPVMLAGVGHSSSTHGSLVDFYVSGDMAEDAAAAPSQYSESLMLLPGAGVVHSRPWFPRASVAPASPPPFVRGGFVRVNCAFSGQKVNAETVAALQDVLRGARKPVLLRFFPGAKNYIDARLLRTKLRRLLGVEPRAPARPGGPAHDVHVLPQLPHEQYWSELQKGHIGVESHPYGGCNTVVDSLHVGLPFVAWRGPHWRGRIGAHVLEQAGLGDAGLVADTRDGFVAAVLRLVNDDGALAEAVRRVRLPETMERVLSPGAEHHLSPGLPRVSEEAFFPMAVRLAAELKAAGGRLPKVVRLRDELAAGARDEL